MAKEYSGKAKSQLMPEETAQDDKLKTIKGKIDDIFTTTKPVREQMTRNLELFEGKMWKTDDEEFQGENRSQVQYNTIFAAIQSVAPMVTDNRPITRIAPRFPWMEKIGVTLNHVTKYLWNALDMQMTLYRAVVDAMVFGHAIFKLGYNPDKSHGGEVELSLVDPRDFFIAPGYDTVWEAPFCGVKADKPIAWVKKYFDVEEVKGAVDKTNGDKAKKNFKFGDIDNIQGECYFVTVYELWTRDDDAYEEFFEEEEYETDETEEYEEDGEVMERPKMGTKKVKKERQKYPYGKICYFTEEQWLGEEAAQDEHNLPPYVEMWDYIKPHDFTGMSEVTQIEGLHKELNLLLKYLSEYVRRYHNPNILIDTSTMIDEEMIKSQYWEGGKAFTFDGMSAMGRPPIQPLMEPQLNPQVFNLFTILPQIIEEVSGVTDVTKGNVGKQERQSASEIAILLESSHTRTRQRVRNLEWSLKRVYYMLMRLVLQHYETPRTVNYEEGGIRQYAEYGNDKAMANDIMKPQPLPDRIDYNPKTGRAVVKDIGVPLTDPEDLKILNEYKREYEDYQKFLQFFNDVGDLDPIYFDFDIEIQTDSMLPMDKQARANLYLRLLQMKAIDPQAVLEFLQIPNASEIIKRMNEREQAAKGGGQQMDPRQQQLMQQNPQLAQRYMQETGQGG